MSRFVRIIDVFSVFLAGPIAMGLRDPTLLSGVRFKAAAGYCLSGYVAGLAMIVVFHVGQSIRDYLSAREIRAVVAASFSTTALTAIGVFSFDRLNDIPRSLPLIQLIVLCFLMVGGRGLATRRRPFLVPCHNYAVQTHTLLIGANEFALSYLKMLDAFHVDHTNIVAILDRNYKLFGRALCGHPVIGPPTALTRVVREYRVHGVDVDRVLVCENRPDVDVKFWSELEEECNVLRLELAFLSDVLGFRLGSTVKGESRGQRPAVLTPGSRAAKRAFDLLLSLAVALAFSPIVAFIVIGVMIDLGWPVIFWQKRVGYHGRPFLIYKFRTLHAPYDRQGNFLDGHRRSSRFGAFLRRARFDELPQLWNVFRGDMSFVGPRPLLPVDQPTTSRIRLAVRPGVTGWAQINGGRVITADEKGVLDDWYVHHASFRLDLRIIMKTIAIVFFGDDKHLLGLKDPSRSKDSKSAWRSGGEGQPTRASRRWLARSSLIAFGILLLGQIEAPISQGATFFG